MDSFNRVRQFSRFGGRCAYCHGPADSLIPHDHVVPRTRGGGDTASNLVPACWRCNTAKGDTVGPVRDPHTGARVRLFNPLEDVWANHFLVRAGQLVGKTAVGRATAALLRRPLPAQRPEPSEWPIISVCTDSGLGAMVAALRDAHDRADVPLTLAAPKLLYPWTDSHDRMDAWAASFVAKWIPAITRFKRSQPEDVLVNLTNAVGNFAGGAQIGPPAHEELWRLEWLATSASNAAAYGAPLIGVATARQLRGVCVALYRHIAADARFGSPELGLRALAHQYQDEPGAPPSPDSHRDTFLAQLEHNSYQALGDYLDALMYSTPPSLSLLERMADELEVVASISGYGAGGDRTEAVALRRRWWLIRAQLGLVLDGSLLSADLALWRELGLVFELRALKRGLRALCADDAVADVLTQ